MASLRVGPARFPGGERDFLLQRVQTGYGAYPAFSSTGIGALFREVKRPAGEACDSPPFSAEVMNEWNYTSTPHSFHRDNSSFVCIAVKAHCLEKLKFFFHYGGGTGVFFFTKLPVGRKGQDEMKTQRVFCETGATFGNITQLHLCP